MSPSRPHQPTPNAGGPAERFRPRHQRPELHRQERWTLFWVALHLLFLPWAIGTMHAWSQCVSLGLALVGFVVAAQPRRYEDFQGGGDPVTVQPLRRLRSFPLFWLGLFVLLYITVQGLNPAVRFCRNATYWWIEAATPVPWLPAGVDAPFADAGPWRALIIHAALWLTLCTVWIGFMRRRTFQLLFVVLVISGVLLALLGVAQQLTHATGIFWSVKSRSPTFVASFVYRNHAGAYLNLALATTTGLAWWAFRRSSRRFEKSSPAGVFVFGAALIGTTVAFTLSRGAIITLIAFAALLGLAFLFGQTREPAQQRNGLACLLLVMLVGAFIGVGFYSLDADKIVRRFEGMVADPVASAADRTMAHSAAADMLAARPVLGWGAGCFRYCFPTFQRNYPKIYFDGLGLRKYWEYAHNDILQYPIEFGLVGFTPLLAGLLWLGWRLVRFRFWANPLSLAVAIGATLTLVHAWGDFVFQNPAILVTWAVLLLAAGRWAELDQADGGPR